MLSVGGRDFAGRAGLVWLVCVGILGCAATPVRAQFCVIPPDLVRGALAAEANQGGSAAPDSGAGAAESGEVPGGATTLSWPPPPPDFGQPGDAPPAPVRPEDLSGDGRQAAGNGQPPASGGGVRWGSLYRQAMLFMAIEHGFRLATQADTRESLKGPFFRDYFRSVRGLRGWGDGDPFLTNYIGHGMMGAVTGYMWLNNDSASREAGLKFSREYFKHRLRALTFSAVYSTQFELGPLSEASLGNVGIKPGKKSPHPMSYTDIVVTPTVGTLWLLGEDALERFVVRPVEGRTANRFVRLMVRSWLNPSRSFANLLRGKWFWYRDDRRL